MTRGRKRLGQLPLDAWEAAVAAHSAGKLVRRARTGAPEWTSAGILNETGVSRDWRIALEVAIEPVVAMTLVSRRGNVTHLINVYSDANTVATVTQRLRSAPGTTRVVAAAHDSEVAIAPDAWTALRTIVPPAPEWRAAPAPEMKPPAPAVGVARALADPDASLVVHADAACGSTVDHVWFSRDAVLYRLDAASQVAGTVERGDVAATLLHTVDNLAA